MCWEYSESKKYIHFNYISILITTITTIFRRKVSPDITGIHWAVNHACVCVCLCAAVHAQMCAWMWRPERDELQMLSLNGHPSYFCLFVDKVSCWPGTCQADRTVWSAIQGPICLFLPSTEMASMPPCPVFSVSSGDQISFSHVWDKHFSF